MSHRKLHIRVVKTKVGTIQWSWHFWSSNNKRLGWSGEFFKRKIDCLASMELVTDAGRRGIPVEIEGDERK